MDKEEQKKLIIEIMKEDEKDGLYDGNKGPRKYRSPVLQNLLDESKKDPWYIKLRRWYSLQKWILVCRTRKFWDKEHQHYIFRSKKIQSK
jgi:hypothetical protein